MSVKNVFAAIWLTLLIFFYSCKPEKKADEIFYNGTVYTVDEKFSVAEAIAIRDGKIVGTGTSEMILGEFDSPVKTDLKGKFVYPGFIDAHCHFFGYASDLGKCNLYGTKSFEEVIDSVSAFAKRNKFSWILGRGWDQNDWEKKKFPTRDKLDSLFPDMPVYLVRVDGHAVLCNAKALAIAGVDAKTKVPGGELLRKNGKPTGLLIDNAVDLVKSHIPPFPKELNETLLMRAEKNCFSVGLTTLDDAGLGKDSIELIDAMQKSGKLKMRVYAMLADEPATLKHYYKTGPTKTERLNVRAVKVYADGSLGSRGACLKKPYSDQAGHYGFLLHPAAYYDVKAKEVQQHGFQMCTHAIGDSAVKLMLTIYEKYNTGQNDRRWRIEHCQVVDPADIHMFGENSILPSVQPTHATSDMYWAEERLGKARVKTAYTYLDLENVGGVIAFGTDFPVENINPLYTFYAAVVRKDLKGFPEGGFQPENKISRKEALLAMTLWAAYSNFEEQEKGTLVDGKFADFVILDKDIMTISDSEIPVVMVMATYVNGEKVFEPER